MCVDKFVELVYVSVKKSIVGDVNIRKIESVFV